MRSASPVLATALPGGAAGNAQAVAWSAGYIVFAISCAALAVIVRRRALGSAAGIAEKPQGESPRWTHLAAQGVGDPRVLVWRVEGFQLRDEDLR